LSPTTATVSFTNGGKSVANTHTDPPQPVNHPSSPQSSDSDRTITANESQAYEDIQPTPTEAVRRRRQSDYGPVSSVHGIHRLNRAVIKATQNLSSAAFAQQLVKILGRENERLYGQIRKDEERVSQEEGPGKGKGNV
jgi:hypothetical protein